MERERGVKCVPCRELQLGATCSGVRCPCLGWGFCADPSAGVDLEPCLSFGASSKHVLQAPDVLIAG